MLTNLKYVGMEGEGAVASEDGVHSEGREVEAILGDRDEIGRKVDSLPVGSFPPNLHFLVGFEFT